ncbi:MAG TPA: L-rhamnose mutarotase [Pontiellaceae bacterium]|nr:L-rhamnose mutarotase [Pontiellaceae bacterium]HPR82838.1 L-rhamnose mutarotase [Pontiellaceae bacterium]
MKFKILIALYVAMALSSFGFSPYENYLLSGQQTHVMLFAEVKGGQSNAVQNAVKTLSGKEAQSALSLANISNVSAYTKELQGKLCVMVYFDYDGKNYLDAVKAFEATAQTKALTALVQPHPRAAATGTSWLQMEWVNYIYGAKPNGNTPNRFAMVTRLKPEKEVEYRLLHQSVWPGTVDRMTRMDYHDFSIFFVEMGSELYEMFYVEFIGTDAGKNKMGSVADPTYERWVKNTDPCQIPLPDASGIWSMMNKISE